MMPYRTSYLREHTLFCLHCADVFRRGGAGLVSSVLACAELNSVRADLLPAQCGEDTPYMRFLVFSFFGQDDMYPCSYTSWPLIILPKQAQSTFEED